MWGLGVRAGGSSGAGGFPNDLQGLPGDNWSSKAPVNPWLRGREGRRPPTGVGSGRGGGRGTDAVSGGSGDAPPCMALHTVGVLLPPCDRAGNTRAAAQDRGLSIPWWPSSVYASGGLIPASRGPALGPAARGGLGRRRRAEIPVLRHGCFLKRMNSDEMGRGRGVLLLGPGLT